MSGFKTGVLYVNIHFGSFLSLSFWVLFFTALNLALLLQNWRL